ncbi:hypothetical protein Tco_0655132 [Tanacetum coccineum]|uniref:Integrase, catalytic region, zinc finger, CCHC-type, peptidase aspartic, catalytic n=1 Tax=Tanacetum coccineum TaxID=301880 RepID=A0ABQ4X5L9_9ASTR
MYKLNPIILAHKVKNNREAHEYSLKHTMEQAAILREVVEQANSRNPLDSASYSACMYVKLIQELLGYVRDTFPDIHKPSEKLVAVTPINKKKTLQFVDTVTSSGNIPKETNRPLFSSTGVNPSTSASESKPSASCKALCSICNECLFEANHAMCLFDHVNSMNVRAKSISKKNKKRKEWKPTGKVFKSIGYKWKPIERTFTLVGNVCPLTRLTATNKVPLRVPIPLEVVAPKHVVIRVYTRRPKVPKSVQNSKPKVAKSMTSNKIEPGTSQRSDTLVAPSSSSLIDFKLSKLFCGTVTISRVYYVEGLGHNLFSVGQLYDSDLEVAFRKHTCFVRNLEVLDEFFSPPTSVVSPVPVKEALAPVESTGSPSSTTVDQDAPSPSTSQTTPQSQSQKIPLCVEEESHDLEVSHMSNDPYFGILIPKTVYEESSSSDVIPTTVHSDTPISKHLSKWKKDHPLQNKIGDPSRPVSTRL